MGAYTEIVDFTFTANETSRTFSGLSITKDDFVKVIVTQTNNSGSNSDLRILANNTSNTNYHTQTLGGAGSSVVATRTNVNRMGRTLGNQTGSMFAYLKLSQNDRLNVFSNSSEQHTSSLVNIFFYVTSSGATFTSGITSLTFLAEQTNGLGTGSRIQIYKLDAEKVADITVTSNTTQVDISNLSIDKDSEYLLVGDITGAVASHLINVVPNDLTTLTGYHNQGIEGDGSDALAFRNNDARWQIGVSTQNSIGYAHIKLSNIGAYTLQGYNIRGQGTSSLRVQNYFVSSTSEAITSITKLNIVSSLANAIGAGSRFTLYKLYE